MNYTRLKLEQLLASHLGRRALDDSIPADLLHDTLNRHRRNAWDELGGRAQEGVTLDTSPWVADYALSGETNVLAVAVRDTPDAYPRALERLTPQGLVRAYPLHHGRAGAGNPEVYTVSRGRTVPDARRSNLDGWTRTLTEKRSCAMVTLTPAPAAGVVGGLVLTIAGPAAELRHDNDVSSLPNTVDECACWRAAVELTGLLRDEDETLKLAAFCQKMADESLERAVMAAFEADGGLSELHFTGGHGYGQPTRKEKAYGYSHEGGLEATPTPGPVHTSGPGGAALDISPIRSVRAEEAATPGAVNVTFAIPAAPVAPGNVDGVIVWSEELGILPGVTVSGDRTSVEASTGTNPETGDPFTFTLALPCYLWYFTEAV